MVDFLEIKSVLLGGMVALTELVKDAEIQHRNTTYGVMPVVPKKNWKRFQQWSHGLGTGSK